MGSDAIRPRSHMCLVVEAEGTTWLADVGFGGQTLRYPISHEVGAEAEKAGWAYRLAQTGATWRLQSRGSEGWYDLYVFREEPQHHVDVEVANHYTATHPASPVVGRLIAQKRGDRERRTVIDTTLTTTTPDGGEARRELAVAEVPDVLEREFAVRLDPSLRTALTAALGRRVAAREPA